MDRKGGPPCGAVRRQAGGGGRGLSDETRSDALPAAAGSGPAATTTRKTPAGRPRYGKEPATLTLRLHSPRRHSGQAGQEGAPTKKSGRKGRAATTG
jgi:hypothetical protein